MNNLFENWQKYINEDKEGKISPEQAIADEGGALGFSKWEELTGMSRDELEKYVKDNDNIKIHKHGDIIDAGGLNEETELAEDVVVDEGKICAKGKAWAMRKYGKWSAYAAMGASRYCKEPGWGRGKKKKKKKKKKRKKKNEEVRDTYGSEVVNRNAQSRKNAMKGLNLTEDSLDEACWDTHKQVGMKKKGNKMVPNCVPKEEALEIDEGELKKWRDENWVQSDGTPCGDPKAQKNPKRCKPKSKWATMSDKEKKADNAKKKAGGKKGKQFVSATKKGKVTKSHTKENYMKEELGKNYHLGRHQHGNPTTLYINFRNLKDVGENMPGGVDPNKISELIEQAFYDNNADYFLYHPFVKVDNTGGGGYIDPSQSKYKVFLKFEDEQQYEDFKTEELDLIMQQVNDKVEKYAMELKQYKLDLKEGKESYMNISEDELAQIIKEELKAILSEEYYEVDAKDVNEEYCPVCREAQELEEKKKNACKPSKGKRFAKRVDGKCRSYGQAGKAKGGGDRIRPGTKKGDAYCARSAGIKKCKNPPCANTLSRKKWKCRGKKSMK